MTSRFKEDEKNERIIRGLLKHPANKKCINCNSLGPQYVCTTFWTFICTNCSGIHREFTHRVKSVSMAKFTSKEVTALQEGGNERAKATFFKDWDLQRHSFPDSSNVERLRTFIKHVYVERKYSGDRSVDRPPRSPSYGESYDRRHGDRLSSSGGRNDDQGDRRRSPGRIEMVDDKHQDDKTGKGNQNVKLEERRFSDGASRASGRSPNNQDGDVSSPTIRPVRDILGKDAPALRVGELPKSNGSRVIEAPPQAQRIASSGASPAGGSPPEARNVTPTQEAKSVTTEAADVKTVATQSLIDFDADFEAPVTVPQEESDPQQIKAPPVESGNWASFDSIAGENPTPATNPNALDSALAQLCAPASASTVSNPSTLPTPSANTITNNASQSAVQPNENSLFSGSATVVPQSIAPQSTLHGAGSSSQPWEPMAAPHALVTASIGQIPQPSIVPRTETAPGVPSQVGSVEVKINERKELPADLFTLSYPIGHGAGPNWHARAHYGMGSGMQYPAAAVQAAPSFSYPSMLANPFDVSSVRTLVHAATFPSLAPLQGALPNNENPQGLLRASSLGPTPQWMPQQQLSTSLAATTGGYMSQVQNNMGHQTTGNTLSMGTQAIGNAAHQQFAIGTPEMNQNPHSSSSQRSASDSFAPAGGNPFG